MRKRFTILAVCSLAFVSVVAPLWGQTYRNDEQIEIINKQDSTEIVTFTEINEELAELAPIIQVHELSMQTSPFTEQIAETTTEAVTTEEVLTYTDYWVSVNTLNVRKSTSEDAEVIDKLSFNEKVSVSILDNGWAKLESKDGYIKAEYLNSEELSYINYDTPVTSGFKSYMPYNVFSSKSNQYKLQQKCNTGNYGIRQYNGRYCVALGSHFNAEIGQYFDLILENGTIIPCVMADQKANCHTDSSNIVTVANGCMTEFVVDSSALDSNAKCMGDVSYCNNEWKSRVVTVRVYEEKVDLR